MDTPNENNEALQLARLKAHRLASCFEVVFGQPKKRTPEQTTVIEHLGMCAGDDQNSYRFHEARDGLAMVAAGIHRDGAKSTLRIIERQLQIAANTTTKKKEKAQTKR